MLGLSADEYVERAWGTRPRSSADRARLLAEIAAERAALRAEIGRRPGDLALRGACYRATVALFALGRLELAAEVAAPDLAGFQRPFVLCYAAFDLLPVRPDLDLGELVLWIAAHREELAWDPARARYGFVVSTEDWVLEGGDADEAIAALGPARPGEAIFVARGGAVRVDGTRRALAPILAALEVTTGAPWRARRTPRTRVDHASRTYKSTSMMRPSLIAARG